MRRVLIAVAALLLVAGTRAFAAGAASTPAGRFAVELTTRPSPPAVGSNQFLITVKDAGKPLSGAGVSVHVDMTSMPMPADFQATPAPSAGQYVATVTLSMAGKWRVAVAVQQMAGMSMAGDGTAHFLLETGKGLEAASASGGKWVLPVVLVLVLLAAAAASLRFRHHPGSRGVAMGLLTLVVVFAATFFVVKRYRDPTVSTVIGSATMDMDAENASPAAVAVSTEVVRPTSFESGVTYTGTVVPDLEEDIYPRVVGRLVSLPWYPGDRVKQGEVVARLEAQELTASAAGAVGGVVAAQNDLAGMYQSAKEAESAVAAARAGVTQAQADVTSVQADATYWKAEIAREQHLYEVGAIAKEELDRETAQAAASEAKLAQAQAGVTRAKQELAQAQARAAAARTAIAAAKAKLQQARAASAEADTMRGYTTLRASRGGVVTARNVSPGVVVQPGTSILKIAKIDVVRLQVNVSEADLASVRLGQRMVARPASRPDGVVSAPVTAIFPAQDPSTRTAVVEARVPNPDERLRPGEYLSVQLSLGTDTAQVLSVPISAVVARDGQASVFVVQRDGVITTAKRVGVTMGKRSNTRVEVLSGLKPGDEAIVSGPSELREGDAVTVMSGPGEVPSSASR